MRIAWIGGGGGGVGVAACFVFGLGGVFEVVFGGAAAGVDFGLENGAVGADGGGGLGADQRRGGEGGEGFVFAVGGAESVFGDEAVVVGGGRAEGGDRDALVDGFDRQVGNQRLAGWRLVAVAARGAPFEVVVGVFAVAEEGAVQLRGGGGDVGRLVGGEGEDGVGGVGAVFTDDLAVGAGGDERGSGRWSPG